MATKFDVTLPNPYLNVVDPQDDELLAEGEKAKIGKPRLGADAIDFGRNQIKHPSQNWHLLCLGFVRTALNIPGVYGTAGVAWEMSPQKHHTKVPTAIPPGVPVFYSPNHMTLSTYRGKCLSTDVRRVGMVDEVYMESIVEAWGLPLEGWLGNLNKVRVYNPAKGTPHITAALEAKTVTKRLAALHLVVSHGNKTAVKWAEDWLACITVKQTQDRKIEAARAALKKLER